MLSKLHISDALKTILTTYIDSPRMPPHMIIIGESGSGKTTLSHLFAKDFLQKRINKNNLDENILFIDSLSRQNVNMLEDIRTFVITESSSNIRVVIIDNIDNINNRPEKVLSSIMDSTKYTLFIFICTDDSELVSSIQSRCTKLYVEQHTQEFIMKILHRWETKSKANGYNIDSTVIDTIYNVTNGSLIKINTILNVLTFFNNERITNELIYNINLTPSPAFIREFLTKCKQSIIAGIKFIETDNNDFSIIDILKHTYATLTNTTNLLNMCDNDRVLLGDQVGKLITLYSIETSSNIMIYKAVSDLNNILQHIYDI